RLDFSTSALRSITFGLNVSGQGKTYWDEANTVSQKFYALLGAHVDFALGQPTGNGRNPVVLSLWMRNLTDTKYNTFAVNSSATGQNLWFAQRGNPMQAGIDLRLHF
ncbi:MAG: TonB-dependent receptor, partial [Prevotella sp.]|nr:TonB-dependent receptor [Prevotella sp.]